MVTQTSAKPQDKLTKGEQIWMLVYRLALIQIAIPIGSALYFIITQTRETWAYPKGAFTFINVYLGDFWDRLPIHFDNAFHVTWFAPLGQVAAPVSWVAARHDLRYVLIGFVAATLIGSITVSLKQRKRASGWYMAASFPLGLLAAIVVAVGLIYLTDLWPALSNLGVRSGNPYVSDFLGHITLAVIGVVAGIASKLVLKRTFDTIQLISEEKNLNHYRALAKERGTDVASVLPPHWKIVYPVNYRKRFDYLVATNHVTKSQGRLMSFLMMLATPIMLFLLGFGIWDNYFGPASHAK